MRLLNYSSLVVESADELKGHLGRATDPLAKRRLRFLLSLKEGKYTSRIAAGSAIGLQKAASDKLWRKYKTKGRTTLLQYPYKGRPSRLSPQDSEALKAELANVTRP